MQAPKVATFEANIDALKAAVANVISQCRPTPSCSSIDREWRTFLVKMVTRPTDRLVYHAETADTQELAHRVITSAHAFLDSVESALRDDAFSNVMNVHGHGDKAWLARADRIFKIEQEAERLRTAFDTPCESPTWAPQPAPPRLLSPRKLSELIDNKIQPGKLGPWIRVPELRGWLTACDEQHAHHCGMSSRSRDKFQPRPRWLVDVRRQCLVRAERHQRYIALSYVWGSSPSFTATRRHLEALQQDNSLSIDSIAALNHSQDAADADAQSYPIPQTVRDVMRLTLLLDQTHLWVDSLCIVQDDPQADKHQQLQAMGSIYANAYVTIVAAGGTAATGLRGINGVTDPFSSREYHRPQWWTQPGHLRRRIALHHQRLLASAWSQRAWTFQEQIFSRRLLVLDATSAIWECHCHVWFEGVDVDDKLHGLCADNRRVVARGFSFEAPARLADYADHVTQYSRRLLTYPEDVLDAFAGILGTLTSVFEGGFICGLPVMFFDAALLWYNGSSLERRVCQSSEAQVQVPPSWSWAAWQGEVLFPEQGAKDAVRSVVEWKYGVRCDADAAWRPLRPGIAREGGKDGVDASSADVASLSPEDDDLPDMLTCYFLFAKAQRAVFKVEDVVDKIGLPLLSKVGDCVGMLTSCTAIYNRLDEDVAACEVVAVSEVSVDGLDVYNVLWIEWKKGVAYRRGVGRVIKEFWPSDTEVIDLVLG